MSPDYLGWCLFVLSFVWMAPSVCSLAFRRLRPNTETDSVSGGQPPAVSVIVAARDEGADIEAALESMLACDYPQVEFIVVNDRSTDDTGEIIIRLAERDSRIRTIHITELPSGWLGKNHALHVASQRASGEFFLFTDGDIMFAPNTITDAIGYVVGRRIDHLCLMPRLLPGSYFENCIVAFFGFAFCIGTLAWLVPTRFRGAYCGAGAFNLVRADAYRQAGGHVPLQMDVLDDVKLGKLLKQSGYRADFCRADDYLAVRWQKSTWAVIRGLEKNAFASLEYSPLRLVLATAIWAAFFIVPFALIAVTPGTSWYGFAAHLAFLHFAYALIGSVCGAGMHVLPMLTVSSAMMMFAFWRSAWVTLQRGGVTWRDSFYPLPELRDGLY